jgi:hypothetical protein
MLSAMMGAHHMIVIIATLSSLNFLVTIPFFSWLALKMMGNEGPALFWAYGMRFVRERVALRDGNKAAYEDGKDMLYRFMEAKDPETAAPSSPESVVKVLPLL